jgi:hypothetical protein
LEGKVVSIVMEKDLMTKEAAHTNALLRPRMAYALEDSVVTGRLAYQTREGQPKLAGRSIIAGERGQEVGPDG